MSIGDRGEGAGGKVTSNEGLQIQGMVPPGRFDVEGLTAR